MTLNRATGTPKTTTRDPHRFHAVLCLSDWHVDERVNLAAATGEGHVNRYGQAIAEARVGHLIRSANRVYGMYTDRDASVPRPPLTIWLGGDFITGAIHEEGRSLTWCTPAKALDFACEQISRVLQDVVNTCKPSALSIVCSVGNHERITVKSQVTVGAGFSQATGLYSRLKERFTERWTSRGLAFSWVDPPEEGPLTYHPLSFGKLGRFLHGDARGFKYNGGVGGLAVPLARFCGRANTEPGAGGAITFLGHYHTFGWHETARAITNGSLIGYNGFARSIGATFEYPAQAMAILSPHDSMGPLSVHRLVCGE